MQKKQRAIVYVRWSSDDQTAGNSLERQRSGAEKYCKANGLEIEKVIVDDGYSAFKGHHISKGNLGKFLREIDKGDFSGAALVIEAMDRLSRQGIMETLKLTERLLNAGLEIHVSLQNPIVRSLDDLATLLLTAVEGHGANEYSRKLKERVGNAWKEKKHEGPDGYAITNRLPGWFQPVKTHQPKGTLQPLIPDLTNVRVVQQVFEWASQGLGKRTIARKLNAARIPTFGGGREWVYSYIGKLLNDRRLLGEYQPYSGTGRGRTPDGPVRPTFYPKVIDPALWDRAHRATESRKTYITREDGKVFASGKHPGKTGLVNNLFTSLVFANGRTLVYEDKGKKARPKLVNPNVRGKLDYLGFERAFLRWLDQLDWKSVLNIADSEEITALEKRVADLRLELNRNRERTKTIGERLIETPSEYLKGALTETEKLTRDQSTELARLDAALESAKAKHADLLSEEVVFTKLATLRDPENRQKLREEIRWKVARIEVNFDHSLQTQSDNTFITVEFVNGVQRNMFFRDRERVA